MHIELHFVQIILFAPSIGWCETGNAPPDASSTMWTKKETAQWFRYFGISNCFYLVLISGLLHLRKSVPADKRSKSAWMWSRFPLNFPRVFVLFYFSRFARAFSVLSAIVSKLTIYSIWLCSVCRIITTLSMPWNNTLRTACGCVANCVEFYHIL